MRTYSTLRVKFWTVVLTISSILAAFSVLPNVTIEASSPILPTSSGLVLYFDAANPISRPSNSSWVNLVDQQSFPITSPGNQVHIDSYDAVNFTGSTSIDLGSGILGSNSSYTKEAFIYQTDNDGSRNIISSQRAPFWFQGERLRAGNAWDVSENVTVFQNKVDALKLRA
jgi:hypothetical protein